MVQQGDKVLAESGQSDYRVLDFRTGQTIATLKLEFAPSDFAPRLAFCFLPDDKTIAYFNERVKGKLFSLYSAETGSPLRVSIQFDANKFMTLSPNGQYAIVTINANQSYQLVELTTGKTTAYTLDTLGFPLDGTLELFFTNRADLIKVTCYPSRYFTSGNPENVTRFIDVTSGKLVKQYEGIALESILSPDGKMLLGQHVPGPWRLLDLTIGAVLRTFSVDTTNLRGSYFSPYSKLLLDIKQDSTVLDLSSGAVIAHLPDLTKRGYEYSYIQFTPDGQSIVLPDGWLIPFSTQALIDSACARLTHDLDFRLSVLYDIQDDSPTCPQFAEQAGQSGQTGQLPEPATPDASVSGPATTVTLSGTSASK